MQAMTANDIKALVLVKLGKHSCVRNQKTGNWVCCVIFNTSHNGYPDIRYIGAGGGLITGCGYIEIKRTLLSEYGLKLHDVNELVKFNRGLTGELYTTPTYKPLGDYLSRLALSLQW